jgi:hypothetical protein
LPIVARPKAKLNINRWSGENRSKSVEGKPVNKEPPESSLVISQSVEGR